MNESINTLMNQSINQ